MSDQLVLHKHLAMPELMIIDSRRQEGDLVAPPMRRDFYLRGPMVLEGDLAILLLAVTPMGITVGGMQLGFNYATP